MEVNVNVTTSFTYFCPMFVTPANTRRLNGGDDNRSKRCAFFGWVFSSHFRSISLSR